MCHIFYATLFFIDINVFQNYFFYHSSSLTAVGSESGAASPYTPSVVKTVKSGFWKRFCGFCHVWKMIFEGDIFETPHPSVSLYDRFYKLHKCLESLSRELDLPESVVTSKRWELCWFDWNWDSSHAYSDVRVIEPVTNIKRNRNRSTSEDIIIISIGFTSCNKVALLNFKFSCL